MSSDLPTSSNSLQPSRLNRIYNCLVFVARNTCCKLLALLIINGAILFLFYKFNNPVMENSVRNLIADSKPSSIIPKFASLNNMKGQNVLIYDYAIEKRYFPDWYWKISILELSRTLRRNRGASLPLMANQTSSSETANWIKLRRNIRQYSFYDPDDPTVEAVLKDMATLPIVQINDGSEHGTQLKLLVKFKDGGGAMLKPKRETFTKSDRHFAEIAAFHLDRILGYYRVPPTVGRHVNIMTELVPLFPGTYRETVFRSHTERVCFYGKCAHQCTPDVYVCGTPDHIEVSLQFTIPVNKTSGGIFMRFPSPWKTTRGNVQKPEWVSEQFLCNKTRQEFRSGNQVLLDVLDAMYFDMVIDNAHRHHFALYSEYFGKDTTPFMLDQGKGFRSACEDEMLNYFLYERGGCCLMRKTTFLKYYKLFLGPERLSDLMRESMKSDPIVPVLNEDHLNALDRRVNKLMFYIADCLEHNKLEDVILDDMDNPFTSKIVE